MTENCWKPSEFPVPYILILTGGSNREGVGHIVRSATLADLFIRSGCRVKVVCDPDPAFSKLLSNPRIELISASSEELSSIENLKPDTLITDLPPERDRNPISAHALKSGIFHVAINDLLLANGSYDLCINPSLVPVPAGIENTFSGSLYAVLNKRITDSLSPASTLNERVEKIFVSMGGTDPGKLTWLVLAALRDGISRDTHISVVSTKPSPDTTRFKEEFRNLHFKNNSESIGDILKNSDMAIVSGGITLYECCFAGIPPIIIPQNSFQRETGKVFEEKKAGILLRSMEIKKENSMGGRFEKLLSDFETRRQISAHGRALIDGRGGERVVDLILEGYRKFCIRAMKA